MSLVPLFILAHFGHHLVESLHQPMLPYIRDEFKLNYQQSASVPMVYSLSSGFGQLLAGWLADRIGRRILITIGIVGVAAVGILIGLSQTFTMLLVFFVLMGLAGGGYHPSASPLIASAVDPKIRGRALGFHLIGGSASYFLMPIVAAAIAGAWGWRTPFISLAIPSAIVGIVIFIALGRRPELKNTHKANAIQQDEIPPPKSKKPLIAFLTFSVIGGGIGMSAMHMLPLYMVDTFHISRERAASLLAIIASAGLYMGPIGGWLSDRVGRVPIILTCGFLSGIFILLLTILPYGPSFLSQMPLYALLFLMGINNYLRMPVSESYLIGQTSAKRRSTIFGVYNFSMRETGAVFAYGLGWLADTVGFNSTFTIVGSVSLVLTVILSLFLWRSEDR
jgi:MFS family permease